MKRAGLTVMDEAWSRRVRAPRGAMGAWGASEERRPWSGRAPSRPPRSLGLAAALLLVLGFVLPVSYLARKSLTGDEVSHISAGYSYWKTGEIVLNPMHPPLVKEIAALPLLALDPPMPVDAATVRRLGTDITYQWEFGTQFFSVPDRDRLVFRARVPVVLLSLGTGALILLWASSLWGLAGGVLALALWVLDPTITAHSQFVTTDVALAFFATAFVFLLRRHALDPSPRRLVACGIVLGCALGAKFSAVSLLPVASALALLVGLAHRDLGRTVRAIAAVAVMALVAAPVLWAIYLFPDDPLFYWRGMRAVQGDYDPRYLHFLMGEFRTGRWPSYFLVAWIVKTPIPTLLVVASALWLAARGWRARWLEEAFVLVPGVVLFAGYSLLADPIGLRYAIPCYPFLYIFAGRAGAALVDWGRRGAWIAIALVAWLAFEHARIAPDHLSYFNPIAGGPRGGLRWLDDSNVDWGQGLFQLRDWLEEHEPGRFRFCYFAGLDPGLYGIEAAHVWIDDLLARPAPGTLILSAHCVARIRGWLAREHGEGPGNWIARLEPEAVVGHAYYVYEIRDGR